MTGIMDLFGKEKVQPAGFYAIRTEFHPYSLKPHVNDFVELEITLENISNAKQLTSLVISMDKGLGVDRSAISQEREIRLGVLAPQEKKFMKVQVWATQRTEPGTYGVRISAIANYNDYAHMINSAKKTLTIRVE